MSNTGYARVVCLLPNDPELQRAWQTFADPVLAHAGEVIEYMGTAQAQDGLWHHLFRHRCHPQIGYRKYWHLPAAPGWTPEAAGGTAEV